MPIISEVFRFIMGSGMGAGLKVIGWRVALVLALATRFALASSEPVAVAGVWEPSAGVDWLLRDPLTAQSAALLDDPFQRVSPGGAGVLQGTIETASGGLPVIQVQDVSPEFWAQPSVWIPFQRGPSAYSGIGRDSGPREWAGRPEFDRRAYALDPGWRKHVSYVAGPPSRIGAISVQVIPGSVVLSWRALPGRRYVVESTAALGERFQSVRTIDSRSDQNISLELPINAAQEFYRVAETVLP
jgi:hypothetical protein